MLALGNPGSQYHRGILVVFCWNLVHRGVAQPGSAPALGDQGSQYGMKILADFPARFLLEFGQRGVAQPGSAPALGAGGPRFESGHPDHHLFIRRHGGFFVPLGKCRLSASNIEAPRSPRSAIGPNRLKHIGWLDSRLRAIRSRLIPPPSILNSATESQSSDCLTQEDQSSTTTLGKSRLP
jgi:hypothetical protein